MKLFSYGKDGGEDSTVWGWWLIESKPLFSIALLCFENGSREAYHSHAFNSLSWVLKGKLVEDNMETLANEERTLIVRWERIYRASFKPVITRRERMHKVSSKGRSWVLTFRGPWANTWKEWLPKAQKYITLTHGRKQIA